MKIDEKIKDEIEILKKAYDKTVDDFNKGINPLDDMPENFKKIDSVSNSGSGAPEIKEFLNPKKGMKFLDLGCCANLYNHRLDKWPSEYYGVDISPKLINAMKRFVERENIKIGGLFVNEISELPFEDDFFDIVAAIGVLEYFNIKHIGKITNEISRVLKKYGKVVIDMPNLKHKDIDIMFKQEEFLGRPRLEVPNREKFEEVISKKFKIEKIDDSGIMTIYYIRKL